MEEKIDAILEKMKKVDSIDTRLTLLHQEVSGIKGCIKQLDTRVSDIENAMAYMETDYSDIKDTLKTEGERTRRLEEQLKHIEVSQKNDQRQTEQDQQIEYLKRQNEILAKHINDLDSYSRRSNLIFEGVPESKRENPWYKIEDILTTNLGIDTTYMQIERCHRLHSSQTSPKPIIIRFNWFANRQEVWENRRKLKGTSIFIKEDFPPDIQRARQSMNATLSLAKTADKRATLKTDKLIFKGEAYSADNIPAEVLMLGDAGPAARIVNDHVCFSGRASPFSNFYPAPFAAEGKKFPTSEHFYQFHKAKWAKDEMAAANILAESDPAKAKRIGDKVKPSADWYGSTALRVMTSGILQKFQQNEAIAALLAKCASLKFAECSKYDLYWGNGLRLADKELSSPTKWRGRNMLGACLNEAAKHFRKLYSQAAEP